MKQHCSVSIHFNPFLDIVGNLPTLSCLFVLLPEAVSYLLLFLKLVTLLFEEKLHFGIVSTENCLLLSI